MDSDFEDDFYDGLDDEDYTYNDSEGHNKETNDSNRSLKVIRFEVTKGRKGYLIKKHVNPRAKKCETDYEYEFAKLVGPDRAVAIKESYI
jgi:hypothetical protein